MRSSHAEILRLLRWYPLGWRKRYGDELAAMMEDDLDGRLPGARYRIAIVMAGLRERGHENGLFGSSLPPAERARCASLLVLCAWTVFVLAGAAFSKLAEHFGTALPAGSRSAPTTAFDVVEVVAIVGGLAVVIGTVVMLPAFGRFIRQGGWHVVNRHVRRASVASVVVVAATIGLVAWGHSLTAVERNGGSLAYGLTFLGWVSLVATALLLWTTVAVVAGRRVVASGRVMMIEGGLGALVAVAMVVMTIATAVWWGTLAVRAPWFLHGAPVGHTGSPFEVRLALTMLAMTMAAVAGGIGVMRVVRSVPRWRPSGSGGPSGQRVGRSWI